MTYDIKSTVPVKWYQFRRKLSNFFLRLAKKTYPDNPDVTGFMTKLIMDEMITGKAIVRFNPAEPLEADEQDNQISDG